MTPPPAKNSRTDVDPIDVAIEQLDARGRSLLSLKALAEAVGMNAPALIKHHGRLDDLLDEADVRRFTRAGRALWRDALPALKAAQNPRQVGAWLDERVREMFGDEAVKARRARTAALADAYGREDLAARLKQSFDQERDELVDALTTLTDRGLQGLPNPREASLLLLTLLFMPTFLDVHPRLTRPAAQAMAQRYRRALHHVILGKAPPTKALPLPGSLGMDDVVAPELPSLTPFGEEVVQAAIALLDEEGKPTIKIGPLTEKVGANVSRVYREVGDVATIDRHAQARRLIGAAIADIDALHAATPPTSPSALRDLLHAVLDEGLGAGRVAMRRRRLSALGASFGRADLTALAAVHHVEATHRAVELITPWRDALDLPTHVAATSLWAMGIPIGLAHVDPIAEGHHDALATFLIDLLHADLIDPGSGQERPKTLKSAVTHAIRRGDTWRTGPSNATRDALVNAAIERAATPGKSLESSALARDVGLTDVAAHYYFASLDSLIDEAALTAGQRALDALRDMVKPDAPNGRVEPDAFLNLLLTHQAAIALQRFTSLPHEAERQVAKGTTPRVEAWGRFIDGAAAVLAPNAGGADHESVRAHVCALLYATQGMHIEASRQVDVRELDSVREVLSSTLLPALRSVVAKPGDAP